jgi:signal transduction histidine kinase
MDARRQSLPPGVSSPAKNSQQEHDERLRLLIQTGLALASERDLDTIVRTALDAALAACRAQFGAFFYTTRAVDDVPVQLYKLSVEHPEMLAVSAPPPLANHFDVNALGAKVFWSDDLLQDREYGGGNPFAGTAVGHLALRSYLFVPVITSSGDAIGGMLFGHGEHGKFQQDNAVYVGMVTAQVSAAMVNARLAETLTEEIALADSARAQQRETAERLRQALDAGQLGTWTWDRATDQLDLDERANELLDGDGPHVPVSRTELRKRIVHEDDLGQTAENMRDILLAGKNYNAEYRVHSRDGRQYWVSSRGIATFGDALANGGSVHGQREMKGMIGTVQDVTARKTQEASLRQSEKLIATGRLAATIAHEINNPLEAVTNLIYLSKTDPGVPGPIRHLLETADNELARVAQIAQQTLGFYRDTTRPVDIDMTALLEGVVSLFSRRMEYKKIKCRLDIAPDLHIYGLQGEVRQVFSNLLVNAIDASAKSSICVRAKRVKQKGKPGIAVVISDQGSGIPAAIRQRLFSPFFTTKESVGTGLGLWVTRGIVEKQGGSIRFRSSTEAPSGTVFRVFLPGEFLDPDKFATQPTLIQ